ncbi:MAG TPA: hypothetical protein VGP18_10105 [Solirubrobacteraceae bacterium]|jgi:hypothetical protein|nr:hypothetical protein [Solirubrobacteraceae bacterium]
MTTIRHPRPALLFAVGLLVSGAFAVLGSAPAFSYTPVYGSGAALQTLLQNNILIPKSPSLGSFVTYDATTSGGGFKEFGNTTGKLAPAEDKVAGGLSPAELDAYVGVDSGPTTAELENAREAATGSKTSANENEIAVPVAQTPLDLLLSLPAGVTLNSSQHIDLGDVLAGQLFAGTAPAAGGYSENTWGAFLTDVGLTAITSGSPTAGQFLDSGAPGSPGTGGYSGITVEVRKEGAGTTVNLKQFLPLVDPADWGSIPVDSKTFGSGEWPAGATLSASPGTANDAAEVAAVDDTPGSVGYATAGDANVNPGVAFTNKPSTSTDASSASHQILYVLLQDNYNSAADNRTPAIYADPETNSSGTANIYTGSNIKVNGNAAGGVGSWVVPNTGGNFNAAGTWTGTRASDPDVYDDSGDAIAYYPLVAIAFDLSWSNFAAVNGANYTSDAQATTEAFLSFATSNAGQNDILGEDFYAPLPSDVGNSSLANIQAVANAAASGI